MDYNVRPWVYSLVFLQIPQLHPSDSIFSTYIISGTVAVRILTVIIRSAAVRMLINSNEGENQEASGIMLGE